MVNPHPISPLEAVAASSGDRGPELKTPLRGGVALVTHDEVSTAVLSFLAGGISGSLGKTIVAPLDRVKIIFQISRMPYSAGAVYAELTRTLRYEGFAALFRGNWAQVGYSVIDPYIFGVYLYFF